MSSKRGIDIPIPSFWLMHLMTLVWLIFTIVLFILEPVVLHRWFREQAMTDSDVAFRRMHSLHKVLLVVSLVAILGAITGTRGLSLL